MFLVNNRGAEMPCLMFWWGTFSDESACPGCLAAAALKWLRHSVALTLSAPSGSWPPPAPATLPNVGTRSLVPVTSPSWLLGSLHVGLGSPRGCLARRSTRCGRGVMPAQHRPREVQRFLRYEFCSFISLQILCLVDIIVPPKMLLTYIILKKC